MIEYAKLSPSTSFTSTALPKYYLCVGTVKFASYTRPNAFHRFMQKIFLGITWEVVE